MGEGEGWDTGGRGIFEERIGSVLVFGCSKAVIGTDLRERERESERD